LTFDVREQTSQWTWKVSQRPVDGFCIPVVHYVGKVGVTFFPAPLTDSDLRHAVSISDLGLACIELGTIVILLAVFGGLRLTDASPCTPWNSR
jgi:NO-binding membrane sensor protein with MHYT domain